MASNKRRPAFLSTRHSVELMRGRGSPTLALQKEIVVKKLVLGAAATAAVAAGVALVPSVAGATGGGSTPPANSITISSIADYGLNGTNLDIDLQVRCTGGSGFVDVTVDQYYPETPNPLGAHGFSPPTAVVCDGRTRLVNVTIVGTLYDGGKAKATAELLNGAAKSEKWITIIAH
jgi:hypothetical protein